MASPPPLHECWLARYDRRRVWLYLKERFLSHRLHDDYNAIFDAACKAWRRLTAQAGRIESLCTYPWIPKVKT